MVWPGESTRFFFNKEHLYKELQAENWQKIEELLRNCLAWDYKTINNIPIIVSLGHIKAKYTRYNVKMLIIS